MSRTPLTKEEVGFGGYTNADGKPYTFLIANGYCRGCDMEHLLKDVESMRWLGLPEDTTFYCKSCGAEHIYNESDYLNSISKFNRLLYATDILKSIENVEPYRLPLLYFNTKYALEKLMLAVELLRDQLVRDDKNLYTIRVSADMLWRWHDVIEDHSDIEIDIYTVLNEPLTEKDLLNEY